MGEVLAMTSKHVPPVAVRLDDAVDPTRCGHKAATLAELRKRGHNVPDGFVIPVGMTYDRDALLAPLAALGEGPYAVRSSGVAEDLAHASFAGQYESVIGVASLDDVISAAGRVLASGTSARATAYRSEHGASHSPLAVLVQRQVAAEAAGVMFTKNPVTGDDECVVEAVRGLGDKLADGSASAERWVQRGTTLEAPATPSVLDAALAKRLVELGARIERERGEPQDIEWASVGDEIFVLQARPITNLPRKPAITIPTGRWTKDTGHFTGPVTPAAATILLPAYEKAMEAALADFGVPMKTIHQRSFGGEVYTQDIDLDGKHHPGAPPPWWLLGLLVRVLPSLRRTMRAADAAIAKLTEYPRRWDSEWRAACAARIEAACAVDVASLSDAELQRHFDELCDKLLVDHLTIHFQLTMPGIVSLYELKVCTEQLLGWDLPKTMNLFAGLSSATIAATRELETVARELTDDLIDRGLDAVLASPAGPAMKRWLAHWGLRTIDVDPGTAMLAEREPLVLSLLREARKMKLHGAESERPERRDAVAEAHRALTGADRARFDAALALAEPSYTVRDDNVIYTEHLPNGLIRRASLEIGRRLAKRGVLRSATDIGYLERLEIAAALAGSLTGERAIDRIERRKAEEAWVRAHPGPAMHGPALVGDPDLRGLPAASKRVMTAALWAMHEELGAPPVQSEDGGIRGMPVSPGRYSGRVRVIRTEVELAQLQPGEVLVCPTTHSSWTVAFSKVGALVTDGGSILSHPAIIAREHAIPAVMGTTTATATLRTGDLVTVDGNTGRVERA